MSIQLSCKIVSTGAWGSYFENVDTLRSLLMTERETGEPISGPKPSVIPANERRRAPLTVRLAVESSWQATQNIDVSPQKLSSVFVSGYGDTDLTDYMCKVLASDSKQLSPTKFHNSVHNAPAGYWTISTAATKAANSVAGYHNSVSVALLEAMIQCQVENTPVLVTFYDAPVAPIMQPILDNNLAFAGSLIIYPVSTAQNGILVNATVNSEASDWPAIQSNNAYLIDLYRQNPAAKSLCIFEKILMNPDSPRSLCLPLSSGSSISMQFL